MFDHFETLCMKGLKTLPHTRHNETTLCVELNRLKAIRVSNIDHPLISTKSI